jgi:preprotein translocase subunit YajC
MNPKDAILKIKALFEDMPVEEKKDEVIEEGKVEMAEYSLADGTKVMISALEVGGEVKLEDGSAAPDAEHELADGTKIVTVDGIITEVKPKEDEAAIEVEIEAGKKPEEMESEFNAKIEALAAENAMLLEKIKAIESKAKDGFAQVAELIEAMAKVPSADPISKPQSYKFEDTKDIKLDRLNKYRNAILNNKN